MTQGERSQLAREWLWETWQEKGERRGEKKFKERESIFAPICEKSPRCPLAKISFFCSSSSCSPEPPAWKLGRMKAKEEVGEGPSRAAAAGCGSRSRAWLSALAAAPHHGPGSTSEPAELQGGSRGDGKGGKGGNGRGAVLLTASQRHLGVQQWPGTARDSLGVSLCQPGLSPAPPAPEQSSPHCPGSRQQFHSSTSSPLGTGAADGKIS